jgi:glycosyltransferase involved in cell wall biosynthesis
MRVLVATSTFPLRAGDGTPRFVEDLCRALASHCEVTVLAPDAPGAAARERRDGVEIRRFRYFAPRGAQRLAYGAGMPDNLRASTLARLQTAPYLLAQARATRRLVAELRADVVNSHWILPTGLADAWARGRRPGRFRHVVTLHGGDAHLLRQLPFGRSLARFAADRSDALFAVSSNVKANLDAALGRDSGARVQPMGVHARRFREGGRLESPFPDGFLLFVGRLIRIKGASVLLRAFAGVRAAHPGLGLLVIGAGPELPALREEARGLGVADAVEFRGSQPHEQVAAALRSCRVAVVPSIVDADGREEGMPAVVGEALAAGARVVASHSGGIADVLRSGENGWLAQPGDAEDLARCIQRALAEPRPSPVDAAALRSADALDWSRVALAYLDSFRSLAGC